MKRSEAANYARWSAAAALLLACLTAGVYLQRKWTARREKQQAPPPAPKEVTRLSNGLTFSKVEGSRKIFTVDAKKATDFKNQTASLMEDVTITIFGNSGERHDTIHTQSCQYEKNGSAIVCSGEVQVDLESAADAERAKGNPGAPHSQKVHIETHAVTFNRSDGIARTDQQVKFDFPNGQGEAIGVEYSSEEGAIRLLKAVNFVISPPPQGTGKPVAEPSLGAPVNVTGKSADFARDSRVLHLHGPVEARTGRARLLAGEVALVLNKEFRAEQLIATAGSGDESPTLESQGASGPTRVTAKTLTGYFAPEGWLTRMEGQGAVQGLNSSAKETEEFSADSASMELLPKVSLPRSLSLAGNVVLKTKAASGGESRMLQTNELLAEFTENETRKSQLKRAVTLAKGILEWTEDAPQNGRSATPGGATGTKTKLTGDKLELEFDERGKAKHLKATGNVQTERTLPGKPIQTATAQSGVAQLAETGGWSQIDLQGDVRLKEGERSGQASRAVFLRAAQTAALSGRAIVRDSTTETAAPKITFLQDSGEIFAEGGVRSTDFSVKAGSVQLAPSPANISAATLQANAKTGRALYKGQARLWQGDSVLEADSIELLRADRVLNATGNVQAVFPQAASQSPERVLSGAQVVPKKAQLWHVTAGALNYFDSESRAHLEKSVVVKSTEQTMKAPTVELYFVRAGRSDSSAPANPTAGPQQISRALGSGGVTVEQGPRKAVAERGEYSALEGKFVMSEGTPTIFDATQGTTTGRQLTFFLADDTIIVDSENGSRTLTKHRVEK